MKFGKVKVGMRVRVANNPNGNLFEEESYGRIGVVIDKEPAHYNAWGILSTRVRFEDSMLDDWGSHLNLEEVKDEA
ncbi:hypothetical protein HOU36_gp14 [Acinetobacter phage vB_AbaP_B09_Aci08]|uniref:Uncharacterized protein n=1 Tax=Acinetobacter phage vB_AbaP_B09_Aci08 TaxID=2315601 RepID=A0A386KCG0_9CAUD|nr:hypothetical protein HOU36_gp14 [Acinetobacter phage vB_AbaP_B09_Aci08]AYD82904.1 hypothetical protein Aci08_14 [Acinetobacter phage vB_AbaP_B09_Aci08]